MSYSRIVHHSEGDTARPFCILAKNGMYEHASVPLRPEANISAGFDSIRVVLEQSTPCTPGASTKGEISKNAHSGGATFLDMHRAQTPACLRAQLPEQWAMPERRVYTISTPFHPSWMFEFRLAWLNYPPTLCRQSIRALCACKCAQHPDIDNVTYAQHFSAHQLHADTLMPSD
ncbi:hypothetical protein DL89DRAFT_285894 [Linderina pennispora]|uniref:Uncharacterized protein n=1 Tax=Linderina pennispora TaxID=61395 RepID=A0A1Y1W195_9FUNG|nr:uncharacterized protein DL89DRAFT_285894 [Linderina pennispora]ORX67277.1 hypothetical protein DL89DRAFT_285894 [Linderina pennispora]